MLALRGIGVWVTRPEHQATPLCRLLEAAGATAFPLAAIEIKPSADIEALASRLRSEDAFDLIIFTSANAVRFGARLLEMQREPVLAAIGLATARALAEAGYAGAATPEGRFDSEGLLGHPMLANPEGRRVLIVKGLHGRGLLQEELARRGAHVVNADVYSRAPAAHDAAELDSLEKNLIAGAIHVITATSSQIAESLLASATPGMRREFDRVHWLVPTARIAAALRELEVKGPILQAESADDQDLVAAVIHWRASSGA